MIELKDLVACDICGIVGLKKVFHKVSTANSIEWYYCPTHKKPYDTLFINGINVRRFATVEVDEQGNQIKSNE